MQHTTRKSAPTYIYARRPLLKNDPKDMPPRPFGAIFSNLNVKNMPEHFSDALINLRILKRMEIVQEK
jgi:hypothetical protein